MGDDLDADESIGHDRLLANIGNKYVYRFVDLWGKLPKYAGTLPFFTYPYMLFFPSFSYIYFLLLSSLAFFCFLFFAVLCAPDPPILRDRSIFPGGRVFN